MKKISIIVPAYNVEKTIEKCIKSIIEQVYHNIEVIVVNDGSTDITEEIVRRMSERDPRIVIISNQENCGLYRTRIIGFERSTGEYIGFVDGDDYISADYFSSLMEEMEKNDADITMGKLVFEDEKGFKWIHNIYNDLSLGIVRGPDVEQKYWEQEGRCFIWHTIWNKLYKREIWEKALPILTELNGHLIMAEDFVFTSVLFHFSNCLTDTQYGRYYYVKGDNASTSLCGSEDKFKKNVRDLNVAFSFVRCFVEKNVPTQISHFQKWENLYKYFWRENVNNSAISEAAKRNILAEFDDKDNIEVRMKSPNYFYLSSTEYNSSYDDILKRVIDSNIKVISFDVFDTALVRPFLRPTDLFEVMEIFYRKKFSQYVYFAKIREEVEKKLREELIYNTCNPVEDITIDQIYDKLGAVLRLSQHEKTELKELEIELERKYCKKRESIAHIYSIALNLGKKIVFVSDMYLSQQQIERMLKENGYTVYEKVYVSSSDRLSKRTGNLFDKVIRDTGVLACNIVHIGDDIKSDVIKAEEKGICGIYYPKATDFMPDYKKKGVTVLSAFSGYTGRNNSLINYEKGLDYLGNRMAIAIALNMTYDNPFLSFNPNSIMNSSPQFMGKCLLGMHLLAVTKWIYENAQERKYEKLVFIARDGWLPMKAYKSFAGAKGEGEKKTEYFNISRKAAAPLGIRCKKDLYEAYFRIANSCLTKRKIIELFLPILDVSKIDDSLLGDLQNTISCFEEYCDYIDEIYEYAFDPQKANKFYQSTCRELKRIFKGNSVLVDIGYSGRTQEIIYKTTNQLVDGMFIHKNSDECAKRESIFGYDVESFYDFTPSITGAQKEILFSALEPSCIRYELNGSALVPIFENYNAEYAMYYVISEIQNSALLYVKQYTDVFKDILHEVNFRNIEMSYPFEWSMAYLSDFDLNMFKCILFEDDMWEGKDINLASRWLEIINYHNLHLTDNENAEQNKSNKYVINADISGKRVVLYGAGTVGKDLFTFIGRQAVVGWIDMNINLKNCFGFPISRIEQIDNMEYDLVIIAVLRQEMAMEIKDILVSHGVAESKIIWEEYKKENLGQM